MKENLIVTNYGEKLVSVLYRDGRPLEINVENHSLIGGIYLARVSSIVPGIEAAFLEIVVENEKMNVFYSLKDNKIHNFADQKEQNRLLEGDEIVVQITRDAIKTKAPIASAHLVLGGQYTVVSRGRGKLCFSSKIKDASWKDKMKEAMAMFFRKRDAVHIAVGEGERIPGEEKRIFDGSYEIDCFQNQSDILIRTLAFTENMDAVKIFSEAFDLEKRLSELLSEARYKKAPALLQRSEEKYRSVCKKYRPKQVTTDDAEVYEEIKKLGIQEIELRLYEDRDVSLDKLYSIQTLMDSLLQKRVWMKSGAYLVIEYTEALTVIDVNSGKIDINKEPEEIRVRVNMEAAIYAMEQIRLRNISGIILIDFIDMKKENRKRIFGKLEELAKEDRIRTNIVDFTALGLVEITRQRNSRPLHEEMREKGRGSI